MLSSFIFWFVFCSVLMSFSGNESDRSVVSSDDNYDPNVDPCWSYEPECK